MKRFISCLNAIIFVFSFLLFAGSLASAQNEGEKLLPEENFFTNSLHYTMKGMEYLYSKEHGGAERITGVTASELGCLKAKCHVRSCDACHKKELDGNAFYSAEPALAQKACDVCHPVEKDDPDVHFRKGMKCMDCHSVREVHGDGNVYKTYMEPGFFDTRCESCHDPVSKITSHTIHKGKLDCSVCHVRDFPMCVNCHLAARMKDKATDVSIPIKGTNFLVNHDGKVTLANLLTYVYEKKTMITLAPYYPHSITKEGKVCKDCHNTPAVQAVKNNTFKLLEWKDGEMKSYQGFVPVLAGMKWDLVFLDYKDGKWIPLEEPDEPLFNYAGYCSPLTPEQFRKLESARNSQ